MDRVVSAIKTVFPDFEVSAFSERMDLMSLPGWDSMNSINLQMQLQMNLGISFDTLTLTDESTVADILEYLRKEKVPVRTHARGLERRYAGQ